MSRVRSNRLDEFMNKDILKNEISVQVDFDYLDCYGKVARYCNSSNFRVRQQKQFVKQKCLNIQTGLVVPRFSEGKGLKCDSNGKAVERSFSVKDIHINRSYSDLFTSNFRTGSRMKASRRLLKKTPSSQALVKNSGRYSTIKTFKNSQLKFYIKKDLKLPKTLRKITSYKGRVPSPLKKSRDKTIFPA